MAIVYKVHDNALDRAVAMKVIREELAAREDAVTRFDREARLTAQLQHPGVPPVYDIGHLPDGRPYFTMRIITGRTFDALIAATHTREGTGGRGFRRLIKHFGRVCDVIAFAHQQQIVHRDLKPSNVMIGDLDETLVMDWGLARQLTGPAADAAAAEPIPTEDRQTEVGRVLGTPSFMAPEQLSGRPEDITHHTDIYALGAILYQLLANRPPFQGTSASEIIHRLAISEPAPPAPYDEHATAETIASLAEIAPDVARTHPFEAARTPLDVPETLSALCREAMARDPTDRPPDAMALSQAIRAWLDGEEQREQGRAWVAQADELLPRIEADRARARALRDRSRALMADVPLHAPIAEKLEAWSLEDASAALISQIEVLEVRYLQALRAALQAEPSLSEAHERLAAWYQRLQREAEARLDHRQARLHELLVREHDHKGELRSWLKGDGALTLLTDPAGAEVTLHRYREVRRRLVAEPIAELGQTPIVARPLEMGSYLLRIKAPGHREVRYPVWIDRQRRWDGVPPGQGAPRPIRLPPEGLLQDDQIYVPAGWFLSGAVGEEERGMPLRRVWLDGFVIQRFVVTNEEFLTFLNDLLAQGREQDALRYAPRADVPEHVGPGEVLYARREDGTFMCSVDPDGDRWYPRDPAMRINVEGAEAYCRWLAERTGLPWRLPWEAEREKASRGVDGRVFPFGNHIDPAWVCTVESKPDGYENIVVDDFPEDVSPYGVRGCAGHVFDWCADPFDPDGFPVTDDGRFDPSRYADPDARRVTVRGGSYGSAAETCTVYMRRGPVRTWRYDMVGFRPAFSWPPE